MWNGGRSSGGKDNGRGGLVLIETAPSCLLWSMRSLRMLKTPNVSLWRSLFFPLILLPNQSTPFSPLHLASEQQAQILFRRSPVVDLCVLLSLSHSPALLDTSLRLKGTKLDHRDTQRKRYPQHKWLSAGLIDKLPLHFISQTDRA